MRFEARRGHAPTRRRRSEPACRSLQAAASLPAGSGCSTSSTPARAPRRAGDSTSAWLPGFVGISDEPRLGTSFAHRCEPLLVAITAKLELEQRIVRRLTRLVPPSPRAMPSDMVKAVVDRHAEAQGRQSSATRFVPTASLQGPTAHSRGHSAPRRRAAAIASSCPGQPSRDGSSRKPRSPAPRPPRSRRSVHKGRIRRAR